MCEKIMIGAYVPKSWHDKIILAAKKDNRKMADFIRNAVKTKVVEVIGECDMNGRG